MERNKTTKHIGEIKGKLLVFGGVYSNLQALIRLKEISEQLYILPSNIICTGDIVAYCAQPEECVQLIKEWEIHCIAGNVEIQLQEGADDCGCNFMEGSRCDTLSNKWYSYAQRQLSPSSIHWMKTLPDFIQFGYANKRGFILHGSFHDTSEFIFKSSTEKVFLDNFKDTNSNLILSGHCGLPFNHIDDNNNTWINAGVIGMPANNGNSKVWYTLLDDSEENLSFNHHDFAYNHTKTALLMKQEDLPVSYADTLFNGIWDNCDVLPMEETRNQGKEIIL